MLSSDKDKILEYAPNIDLSTIRVVEMIVSTNLLAYSRHVWTPPEIIKISRYLEGCSFLYDHQHSVYKSSGFIFRAMVESFQTPPGGFSESVDVAVDSALVEIYGFHQIRAWAAVDAVSTERDIVSRRANDVSTGVLCETVITCPLCEIPFSSKKCPHIPPDSYVRYMARNGYLDRDELDAIAPYMLRTGVFGAVEVSLVLKGDLPQAKILQVV